ncbi:hypothetical protein HMPREF2097_01056 [Enterococcus faecalis 918]|nr:hypothetical protein HMPREF2097_01056 [Enterococcus faecalis 918]
MNKQLQLMLVQFITFWNSRYHKGFLCKFQNNPLKSTPLK